MGYFRDPDILSSLGYGLIESFFELQTGITSHHPCRSPTIQPRTAGPSVCTWHGAQLFVSFQSSPPSYVVNTTTSPILQVRYPRIRECKHLKFHSTLVEGVWNYPSFLQKGIRAAAIIREHALPGPASEPFFRHQGSSRLPCPGHSSPTPNLLLRAQLHPPGRHPAGLSCMANSQAGPRFLMSVGA